MEAIQLAQMLADLTDLQASQDQDASKALVNANKTLDRLEQTVQARPQNVQNTSASANTSIRREPGNKLARSIFTPPLSRTNSGTPATIPGTPTRDDGATADIDKASTLLSLYEIRAKLKEQDHRSLSKAREKVNALAAKQQAQATNALRPSHQRNLSGNTSQIRYPK